MCALSSHLTSVCVRHRSRGPPVHAPEAARVRFRCGRRLFGPGRCMQHAAPRPCMGRQSARTALVSHDIKIKPLLRRTLVHAAVTTEGKQGSIIAAFTRLGSRLVVFPYHCDSRNHHDEYTVDSRNIVGTTHFAGVKSP